MRIVLDIERIVKARIISTLYLRPLDREDSGLQAAGGSVSRIFDVWTGASREVFTLIQSSVALD